MAKSKSAINPDSTPKKPRSKKGANQVEEASINHENNHETNHDGNHDENMPKNAGNEQNHDVNHDNHDENHDGNHVNHDKNHDGNHENHDGTMMNHDATMMNHDANHDGTMTNHENHDGTHDGTMTDHDGIMKHEIHLAEVQVEMIPLNQVVENEFNPRRVMDMSAVKELAESIQKDGLLQPVTLRPYETEKNPEVKFMVVAGSRRFNACKLINAMAIPAVVKDITKDQALDLALVENLQRVDPHPLDESYAFMQLRDQYKLSIPQIAEKVSKSIVFVYNRLALLDLNEDWTRCFSQNIINLTAAQLLAKLPIQVQDLSSKSLIPAGFYLEDENGNPPSELVINAKDIKKWIDTNYNLMLADAVWDLNNEGQVPGTEHLPHCKSCPKQTCYHPDLFGNNENMENARCMDAECYKAKTLTTLESNIRKCEQANITIIGIGYKGKENMDELYQVAGFERYPYFYQWVVNGKLNVEVVENLNLPLPEGKKLVFCFGEETEYAGKYLAVDAEEFQKLMEARIADQDDEDEEDQDEDTGLAQTPIDENAQNLKAYEKTLKMLKTDFQEKLKEATSQAYAKTFEISEPVIDFVRKPFLGAYLLWYFHYDTLNKQLLSEIICEFSEIEGFGEVIKAALSNNNYEFNENYDKSDLLWDLKHEDVFMIGFKLFEIIQKIPIDFFEIHTKSILETYIFKKETLVDFFDVCSPFKFIDSEWHACNPFNFIDSEWHERALPIFEASKAELVAQYQPDIDRVEEQIQLLQKEGKLPL